MPAIRALLIALDEWVANGREPPPSRLPRIDDGTLVPRSPLHGRSCPRWCRRVRRTTSCRLATGQIPSRRRAPGSALVPQVDADGNEIAGIRLPDIAVPRGTFTGWNLYKAPLPDR